MLQTKASAQCATLVPCPRAKRSQLHTGALQAPDAARLAEASGVFTTLADPTRLHLLWLLARQEADVTLLSERCGASRRCGCVVLTGG